MWTCSERDRASLPSPVWTSQSPFGMSYCMNLKLLQRGFSVQEAAAGSTSSALKSKMITSARFGFARWLTWKSVGPSILGAAAHRVLWRVAFPLRVASLVVVSSRAGRFELGQVAPPSKLRVLCRAVLAVARKLRVNTVHRARTADLEQRHLIGREWL